jgi:hypothetical protein
MKPSKFILNTRYLEICPENKLHRKILDDFTLNDLDAKFIDREDLEKEGYIKINDTYGYSERLEKDAIHKYKEELKDKVFNKLYDIDCLIRFETEGLETMDRDNYILDKTINQIKKEILELLK